MVASQRLLKLKLRKPQCWRQHPKKPQVAATKKPSAHAEKENKAAALNKNEAGKKTTGPTGQISRPRPNGPGGAPGGGGNRPRTYGGAEEGGRSFGSRPQNNEAREQRNNRRNEREGGFGNAGNNEFGNDQRQQPRQFRDRDNRGPPRNRNGEGGGFRGGKREFDRQSGSDRTGVKSVDKRDGAGAHNWGSVKQEIEDVNKSTTDGEATLTDKEESANEQTPEQVAAPEEEETKEMTLDEWKAMREQRSKPQFNLRKAGEGEDTAQWKKMVVLNKKKEGDSEEEFEFDPSLYPQRVGRLQRIVDIQFNFKDSRRGGGGGFGRGRGRAPRPGGDSRGSRFENAGAADGDDAARGNAGRPPRNFGERPPRAAGSHALKVDDERQFPTLS